MAYKNSTDAKAWREAHKRELREKNRIYRQEHATEIQQKRHAKYWQDPEAARVAKRVDHQKHRDERNTRLREARLKNPEPFRRWERTQKAKPGYREANAQRWEAWKKAHPETAKAHKAAGVLRRRARKAKVAIELVLAEDLQALKDSYCGLCVYCPEPATCFDHIIPLAQGGVHSLDNLVPACSACNGSKGAKSLLTWMSSVKL